MLMPKKLKQLWMISLSITEQNRIIAPRTRTSNRSFLGTRKIHKEIAQQKPQEASPNGPEHLNIFT